MARASPQHRLHLLGPFVIEGASGPIHLPTRKVESLFAFLALHPEPHAREQLAALLWGDSTDEQARHSLRTALAALRKSLGDDVILADRETIQLNPDFPLWVDARTIAEGDPHSLIENHAGDLLPEFYDEWILPEREHLRQVYVDALLNLAQEARARGDYAHAIELAQKALVRDASNEKAYQHIIFCLAATGDRIGALKQYDECARRLHDDLGVETSKESVALRDQIEQALTGVTSREALFTNLPHPLTSFIGREKELAELRELVGHTRLLTLTGAGGCGKTRLSIQLGAELANANRFKHGVWWVELAALSDPALVPQTVATVFRLDEQPNMPITTALTNYLRAKELLLVLDNCEHLIDACARLAEQLLSACPQLKILASSREALGMGGETAYRVPSLSVPPLQLPRPNVQLITGYEAVDLFTERAHAVQTGFGVTNANAPALVQICFRLDGIPLAIELAAARVKTLSVEQIAARLDDRFRLLTGGSRTALPRHQTLRAAIDWSYTLLSEGEGAMLRQLSVFAGGWTLEAAERVYRGEQVTDDQSAVLDLLTALVDKSLVVVEQKENAIRYRLLETIRQYAREKLEALGELRLARDRHLDYFLAFAEQAKPNLLTGDPDALNRLETDYDNIRAALEHSLATNPELTLRLAMSLEWFWTWHDRVKEGYAWTRRLLPLSETWGPGKLRARALGLAGGLALDVPDKEAGLKLLRASLDMARAAGDKYQIAWSLYNFSASSLFAEDWSAMRRYVDEGLPLYQELGIQWAVVGTFWALGKAAYAEREYESARSLFEQCLEMGRRENLRSIMTFPLGSLAALARLRGDYASAKAFLNERVQLEREIGWQKGVGYSLIRLGQVVLQERDCVQARKLFEEGLTLCRRADETDGFPHVLAGLAGVAGVAGQSERSARLFGAAEESLRATGDKWSRLDELEYGRIISKVREQLDEATFNAACAEGQKMSVEQALEYALEQVTSRDA